MLRENAKAFHSFFNIDADIHVPHLVTIPCVRNAFPNRDHEESSLGSQVGVLLFGSTRCNKAYGLPSIK